MYATSCADVHSQQQQRQEQQQEASGSPPEPATVGAEMHTPIACTTAGQSYKNSSPSHVSTVLVIAANVLLAVLLVLLNRWAYVGLRFPNMTLTLLHLLVTLVGLHGARTVGLLRLETVPLSRVLPLSMLCCAFTALPNLSLEYNTVGTSLLLRLVSLPTVMIIQNTAPAPAPATCGPSLGIKLAVLPLVLGVFLHSYGDVHFNMPGTVFGLAGAVSTAFYQVQAAQLQAQLKLNALQALYHQTGLASIFMTLLVCVFEHPWRSPRGVFAASWMPLDWALVAVTGLAGFLITLTMFWIVRRTSPLTYNVLSQVKLVMTLIACYAVFREPLGPMQQAGMVLTVSGAFLYTHFKHKEAKAANRYRSGRTLYTASSTSVKTGARVSSPTR
ncbi:solute carrier family 35 member E3-like isoform X2 [Ornithodoros turicata]|uniref:solute carrier family 35 member E3-like isoform X2 n=1 Tax=Ornithodoros turicata TaxID=34597 RepID=UPI003138FB3E